MLNFLKCNVNLNNLVHYQLSPKNFILFYLILPFAPRSWIVRIDHVFKYGSLFSKQIGSCKLETGRFGESWRNWMLNNTLSQFVLLQCCCQVLPLIRPSIRFLKYVSNFFLLPSGIVAHSPQMTEKMNTICMLMLSTCQWRILTLIM